MSKTISIKWSTEDVLENAKSQRLALTENEANEVLELLEKNHDATLGINWEVITITTSDYVAAKQRNN